MNKLFVSYSYTGRAKHSQIIYQGFNNMFLAVPQEPKNEVLLETYTSMVERQALKDLGMESIACDILFFKQVST